MKFGHYILRQHNYVTEVTMLLVLYKRQETDLYSSFNLTCSHSWRRRSSRRAETKYNRLVTAPVGPPGYNGETTNQLEAVDRYFYLIYGRFYWLNVMIDHTAK